MIRSSRHHRTKNPINNGKALYLHYINTSRIDAFSPYNPKRVASANKIVMQLIVLAADDPSTGAGVVELPASPELSAVVDPSQTVVGKATHSVA